MGIKFYCPNGHKVNVKSFLAGKKGLCPKCGVRVDIPMESTITEASTSAGSTHGSDEVDDLIEPASSNHPQAATATPALSLVEDVPPRFDNPYENAHFSNSSELATSPMTNANSNGSHDRFGDPLQGAGDIFLPPGTQAAPQYQGRVAWHIQFSTGQQFGPLDDAVLQQWLNEGRVGPGDLVWREGWPQWQSAKAVFPRWQGNQAGPGMVSQKNNTDDPLTEAVQNSQPATAGTWLRQRHRGKRAIQARLSLVLLGLVVFLFAIILYVFCMRDQTSELKPATPATTAPAETTTPTPPAKSSAASMMEMAH